MSSRWRLVLRALGIALFRVTLLVGGSVLACSRCESVRMRGLVGASWGLSWGVFWLYWDRLQTAKREFERERIARASLLVCRHECEAQGLAHPSCARHGSREHLDMKASS